MRTESKDRAKEVNRARQYGGGGYVSRDRVKSQINGFNTSLFNCAAAAKYFAIAILFLLFCFVAIASAEEATNAAPSISEITSIMFLTLIGVIAIILWVPFFIAFCALREGFLILLSNEQKNSMNLRLKYLTDLRNLRKAQVQ